MALYYVLVLLVAALSFICLVLAIRVFNPPSNTPPTPPKPQFPKNTENPSAVPETPQKPEMVTNVQNTPLDYSKIYTRKWMFTTNEKGAYFKLKRIVEPLGYTLFAKVRLFDLVEPRYKGERNNKWLWKIQAKHCDFVLVDQKLVARTVIELDDSSHDREDRIERDKFVDSVLESCGYKVIHVREITDDIKGML